MKKFNINNYIYIKFSESGEKFILESAEREYLENYVLNSRKKIDGEEYYQVQCWQAFKEFPVIIGVEPLFETTILFDEKDLID